MIARAARPRVLVTRPSADALPLAGALQNRGFDVLLQPLLRIELTDGPPLDLAGVQALLFTSVNGVRAFTRRSDVRTLAVFAVGDATAAAARAEGFASVTSAGGNVDDLARLVEGHIDPAAGKLLHPAGSAVAGDLAAALGAAGFTVERRQLYIARSVGSFDPSVSAALREGAVDAVLFFSPRSAASFVSLVRAAALTEACRGIEAFCFSEAVAEAASSVSWRSVAVAPEPNLESLLATLERELTEPSTPDPESENSADSDDLLQTGDAAQVIDRFGGIRPMATKLGVPVTTVQGWKGRGHIPDNRFAAVRSAAAAHGVDLSSDVSPSTRPEPAAAGGEPFRTAPWEAAPQEPAAASPAAQPMGGSGVAWAALILAIVALAGVASYRYWGPLVGIQPSVPADLAGRIERLESAPAGDDRLRQRIERAEQQIDAVSRKLAQVSAGAGGALEPVTAEIATLRSSVDALSQRIARSESHAGAAAASTAGSLAALREEMAMLRRAAAVMDERVKTLEARRPVSGARIAALAVAAGQLETAVDAGHPYAGALDAFLALAEGDEAITSAAAALGIWAKTGVPTLADLSRRFESMAPKLRTPAVANANAGWTDTLRTKVLSLVNVRPLGKDGESSPVTRAERALARNDLAAAIPALDGISGPAEPWLAQARNRLAADAAVAGVRARIVERLAAEARDAGVRAPGGDGRTSP